MYRYGIEGRYPDLGSDLHVLYLNMHASGRQQSVGFTGGETATTTDKNRSSEIRRI